MASISVEVGSDLFSAPIRAQMTRCISPEETGKVFAMLASLECAVPIITSMIFTNVYNATSGLSYPWAGTFYFCAAGFTLIGNKKLSTYLKSIFVFRINHSGDSLHTPWGKDGAHRHREYRRTEKTGEWKVTLLYLQMHYKKHNKLQGYRICSVFD